MTRSQLQICICLLVNIVGRMKIRDTSMGQFFEIAALVHSKWLGLQHWCTVSAQRLQPACNLGRASTWELRCAYFVRKHPFFWRIVITVLLVAYLRKNYSLVPCVCLNHIETHTCKNCTVLTFVARIYSSLTLSPFQRWCLSELFAPLYLLCISSELHYCIKV